MYPTVQSANKMLMDLQKQISQASDINEKQRLQKKYDVRRFVLHEMIMNEASVRKLS